MNLFFACLAIALATWAGLRVAGRFDWSDPARRAGLPLGLGFGLAPMLLGLAGVLAMAVLPGQGARVHGIAALSFLVLIGVATTSRRFDRQDVLRAVGWKVSGIVEWSALLMLIAFVAAMAFDLLVVPLIQNDALEYATVGRILYESGSLASYPAIRPESEASGFFGPWTHPPLYVGLIGLAYGVQGNADLPLTLRLISPWFLAAGAFCVLTIGRLHSMRVGLLAAMFFTATPMLFLGAASALIDPLPVLGICLSLAAMIGLQGRVLQRGGALGLMLGLALWTHSQAILFPLLLLPLLWLDDAERNDAGLLVHAAHTIQVVLLAVAVMLVVGCAPYLRNVAIFGSPISDNPEVFAYGPLGWEDYFRHQRGIADPVEIVQYGVMKGFFALEAYSWVFWLAVLGLPAAGRALIAHLRPGRRCQPVNRMLACCLGVFGAYMAATALSASLGIDLMIRNERYLLVVIPAVALLAAVGLVGRVESVDSGRWPAMRTGLMGLVLLVTPVQFFVLTTYRQTQLKGEWVVRDEVAKLRRWPPFLAMDVLKIHTALDAVVMTMKPADMYHSGRRMLSYLDPRSIRFYSHLGGKESAVGVLKEMGVTHVHATDYFLPPMFRTSLMTILADERLARLVSDHDGYQIYSLLPQDLEAGYQSSVELAADEAKWNRLTQVVLAGRKSKVRVTLKEEPYSLGEISVNDGFLGAFHRESGRAMRSSIIPVPGASGQCPDPMREIVVDARAVGRGHFQVLAQFVDATGTLVDNRLLGDVQVTTRWPEGRVLRRARVPVGAVGFRLFVEHRGASSLALKAVSARSQCPVPR